MGLHRVEGVLEGLGLQTKDPKTTVRITGTLGKNQNKEFRTRLGELASEYGLSVTPAVPGAKKKPAAKKKK